eukprot:4139268-Alexandrium_andersonii.AAC.1
MRVCVTDGPRTEGCRDGVAQITATSAPRAEMPTPPQARCNVECIARCTQTTHVARDIRQTRPPRN